MFFFDLQGNLFISRYKILQLYEMQLVLLLSFVLCLSALFIYA